MNALLKPEIQDFINANISTDVQKLGLQKNPFPEIDYKTILNQIEAKSKAKTKLPTWFSAPFILYPPKISIEQTSSEVTARYKSEIISGESIIDVTGGFGVDCYYFSKKIASVTHCEIHPELSQIVKHNYSHLQADNIQCFAADGLEMLEKLNQKFDWIYIDPSRRNDVKGKVFLLKDCLPDITSLLSEYFLYTDKILIKTSPIYDISAGLSELEYIKIIHIVAVENEVKELLFELDKSHNHAPIQIKTVNINAEKTEHFDFELGKEYFTGYSAPLHYLYEPNASVMKSQGFKALGSSYNLNKLHKHSHLFTSNELLDFVGRRFEVQIVIPYNKSVIKERLEGQKANITTRNFPESVADLRKKWKISDGGDLYCFFTTDLNNAKIVVICNKI